MSIDRMQSALRTYLQRQKTTDTDTDSHYALSGVISGDSVYISGVAYPYDTAVDMQPSDGMAVYCVLTPDEQTAIIVGC